VNYHAIHRHFASLTLAAALLAVMPAAQAAPFYAVSATFSDGGIQRQTTFQGRFDWDGTNVTNFRGFLSQSMWAWDASTGHYRAGMMSSSGFASDVWSGNLATRVTGDAPLLYLTHQLASATANGRVTVTTFLKNSTDVVMGGGYDVTGGNGMAFGFPNNANRNHNAFFTLEFDASNPTNAFLASTVYGDMTALGLMGPMLTGWMGMTGFGDGSSRQNAGSMGGFPTTLSVTHVPVPAAIWLFGGAALSLAGMGRRRSAVS